MSALSLWWWCLCVVGKQMLHILGRWDSVISCKFSFWITTDFELSAEGEKPFLEPHSPSLTSFCFRSMVKMKNAHVICTFSNPIEFYSSWDFKLHLLHCDSSASFKPWLEFLGLWKKSQAFFLLFFCSLFLGNERRKGNWGNSYNCRWSKWGAHRRSI